MNYKFGYEMSPFGLTGVSGGLGGAVLRTILDQNLVLPQDLRISSFSNKGEIFKRAKAAGIEVRRGDVTKPETLADSYSGAEALFLVSYPSVGEERFKYHKTAIDAAKKAGVKHVLYTSLTWGGISGAGSFSGVYQAHLKTVRYLQQLGISHTIIRESTYAHLWNNFAGFLQLDTPDDFEVVISNDGPHHFSDRNELGEATAKIVANWQNYVGKTITLTGPRAFSIEEIVQMYAAHSGRRIPVRKVGIEQAVAYHKQKNSVPREQQHFLANWASWGEALARGEAGYIDPTFEELLGRRPKDVLDLRNEIFSSKTNALDTKDFV